MSLERPAIQPIKSDIEFHYLSPEELGRMQEATLQIMEKYAQLSKNKKNAERKKSLKKVEKLMGEIEDAFENQLSKLYDDDFLNLDTEVSVLEKTLELEGLKKKKK